MLKYFVTIAIFGGHLTWPWNLNLHCIKKKKKVSTHKKDARLCNVKFITWHQYNVCEHTSYQNKAKNIYILHKMKKSNQRSTAACEMMTDWGEKPKNRTAGTARGGNQTRSLSHAAGCQEKLFHYSFVANCSLCTGYHQSCFCTDMSQIVPGSDYNSKSILRRLWDWFLLKQDRDGLPTKQVQMQAKVTALANRSGPRLDSNC